MPNYVTSRITVTAQETAPKPAKDLILDYCNRSANGEYDFDFNKIVPMPEALNIISGGPTDSCIELFFTHLYRTAPIEEFRKYADAFSAGSRFKSFDMGMILTEQGEEDIVNRLIDYSDLSGKTMFNSKEDMVAYGKKALDNQIAYGSIDWYDWCCKNWGTKWNAGDTLIEENSIIFQTAWSDVRTLIRKWSRMNPGYIIEYEYAEEQTGHYVGRAVYEDGEELEAVTYDDYSKEAYELAFELVGGEDCYTYNENTGTYEETE